MPQKAKATARSVLADPRAYDLDSLKAAQQRGVAGVLARLAARAGLDPDSRPGLRQRGVPDRGVRPAPRRVRADERPGPRAAGHAELFDLDRKILQDNLYGVDLNEEAVHIAKLSLWIKTAVKGKELTSLDHNLRVGNSIVGRPGDRPEGVRLAGRVSRGLRSTRQRRVRRRDRQPAVHPPGVALADQALFAIAVRVLPRHGRPLRLLLRARA